MANLINVIDKYQTKKQFINISGTSPLANPYGFLHSGRTDKKFKQVSNRDEAVNCYEVWFREKIKEKDMLILNTLNDILAKARVSDVNLGCSCAPNRCHGDIIKRYLNYKLKEESNSLYIEGDLLELFEEGYFDLICHGCNCFTTMGKGLAKEIKSRFRQVYFADKATMKGDREKLGTIIPVVIKRGSVPTGIIINAYTQYYYGKVDSVNVDYKAITLCFKNIYNDYKDKFIGIPLIGSGLGGGDWSIIEQIIINELKEMKYKFVTFKE